MDRVLVAYASRHGSTAEIAEAIGQTLRRAGLEVDVCRASETRDVRGYGTVVVGSAAYLFRWMKEATGFVRRNRAVLARRRVWLFSSGPLGSETTDDEGRDLRAVTEPREIAEFRETIHPRDHRVFFGALAPNWKPNGISQRWAVLFPGTRSGLLVGDFRDWNDIEAWASDIARQTLATNGSH